MNSDDVKRDTSPDEEELLNDLDPTEQGPFSTLVISLATSALLYMGEIPSPDGKAPEVNLDIARHNIDMLAVLKDRTRGNLTADEQRTLDSFLYDLRMKFVTKSKH